ncbi:MAG: histone H1 [Bacteroidota bacterium]
MNPYQTLLHAVLEMEKDFEKFYDKGNAAAGTRVRKGLQSLKAKAQELRLDVQSKKTP